MKIPRKRLAAVFILPVLCMRLSGCPKVRGSAGSNRSTSGGVVVQAPF